MLSGPLNLGVLDRSQVEDASVPQSGCPGRDGARDSDGGEQKKQTCSRNNHTKSPSSEPDSTNRDNKNDSGQCRLPKVYVIGEPFHSITG